MSCNPKVAQKVKSAINHFAPAHSLIRNRQGVSLVVSNMILIAAVIAVGFAALLYAQSSSNNYVADYGQTVNADIAKLKEVIAFEYVYYDANLDKLFIYFMNAGDISGVTIESIFISIPQTFEEFQVKDLEGNEAGSLGIGDEAYIVLQNIVLADNEYYTVKLTTGRGSIFAQSFMS